ncbi:hypothetical protein HY771_02250 [Candidatus Uhrbacteria bacterium]|nr:hypothetical protein [Candidatus Uhrbacteria bacterium]
MYIINNRNAFVFLILIFLGVGCTQPNVSDQTPEDSAAALKLSTESTISIRETILGIGGKFVSLFGETDAERILTINSWKPSLSAEVAWQRSLKHETLISEESRKQYFKDYASASIGTQLPNPPEPVYETVVEKGSLQTDALESGTKVLLPFFWQKDQNMNDGSTLIWISKKQYQELVQNRRTEIHLGLFDDSVAYVEGFTDQIQTLIDKLKSSEPQEKIEKNISEIEADIDWKTYRLKVNGVLTDVRAIQAQNVFARYTILANEQNPLILEIILTPASRGTTNLFNLKELGEAFWGYEVTEIGL